MSSGRIEQIGSAEDIYNHPHTRYVADFVGQINLLEGEITGGEGEFLEARTLDTLVRVPRVNGIDSGAVSIAVRPEHLQLVDEQAAASGLNVISGTLTGRTFAGNLTRLFVDVGELKPIVLESRPQDAPGEMGAVVRIGWKPEQTLVLRD